MVEACYVETRFCQVHTETLFYFSEYSGKREWKRLKESSQRDEIEVDVFLLGWHTARQTTKQISSVVKSGPMSTYRLTIVIWSKYLKLQHEETKRRKTYTQ